MGRMKVSLRDLGGMRGGIGSGARGAGRPRSVYVLMDKCFENVGK